MNKQEAFDFLKQYTNVAKIGDAALSIRFNTGWRLIRETAIFDAMNTLGQPVEIDWISRVIVLRLYR